MLWILSILLLVIIYTLLLPKQMISQYVQENLENSTEQSTEQSTDQIIQGLKNTIDILSVKVDQMKTQMATMGTTVSANKAQLDRYNQLIQQLKSQMEEEVKKAK